jgi:hypothetical protein
MNVDHFLFQKCRNNKQRKLANIRTKNFINKLYLSKYANGEVTFYKVKVVIRKDIQSVLIQEFPTTTAKEITVNIGFIKPD